MAVQLMALVLLRRSRCFSHSSSSVGTLMYQKCFCTVSLRLSTFLRPLSTFRWTW